MEKLSVKKIAMGLLVFVAVVYTIAGFFLVPVIGRHVIKQQLEASLHRQVSMGKLKVNPYSFTISLNDLLIKDRDGKVFFRASDILADLSASSIFTLCPVISELYLKSPLVSIIRNRDGSFNFSDLADSSDRHEPDQSDHMPAFTFKNIHISNGSINFTDDKSDTVHRLERLDIKIPFLSTRPKYMHKKSVLDLKFILNKAKFKIHASMTPFARTRDISAKIKVTGMDAVHYLSYLPVPETIKLKHLDIGLDINADYCIQDSQNQLKLSGKLDLINCDIEDRNSSRILKFSGLSVDIAKADIFGRSFLISKLIVKDPDINLVLDKQGILNVSALLQNTKPANNNDTGAELSSDDHHDLTVKLDDFEIMNGMVFFHDFNCKKHFDLKIFPLNARVHDFRFKDKISGRYKIDFATRAGEKISSEGSFGTDPVLAEGQIKISDLVINRYAPYYENFTGCIVKNGKINLDGGFKFSFHAENPVMSLKPLNIEIANLSICDGKTGNSMIEMPEFKIADASFDSESSDVNAGKITAENARILVKRNRNGQMNLAHIVIAPPEDRQKNPSDTARKWKIGLDSLSAENFTLKFVDIVPGNPAAIDLSNININAMNLKNSPHEKGTINADMNWNKQGRINIKGNVFPGDMKADFDIGLKGIDIKSMQPYFTDIVKILVTDGEIHATGKLRINGMGRSKPDIGFSGQASVTDFISLDKQNAEKFFQCSSFYVSGLDVSVFPLKVRIKDISLTDFYSRISIDKKGNLNLSSIFQHDRPDIQAKNNSDAPAGTKPHNNNPADINISNITLQGGKIDFSDCFTRPNFRTGMSQIAGSVKGLSSRDGTRAALRFRGVHGQSSPLDISGTVNPLAAKKSADIHVLFKNIELSDFTPYAAKYLGYKIKKGKLILDLSYKINGNKLESDNRIRFDRFTLGEKVDSPDATSLPVALAIALLKDSSGQINLDLPVSGQINDPEFKIGSIILKMVTNLVLKVVTSPFSVIGSMFGGGEELAQVDFDYGSSEIRGENFGKIDKLVTILEQKPDISLEIQGGYDAQKDAEALRMKKFNDMLKAVKLKKMAASDAEIRTLKDVTLKKGDMAGYIETAYAQALFPKPRDKKGKEKQIDINEKKKLLFTNIKVGKDDLRFLAMDRAQKVKALIASKGRIKDARIFLVEPDEGTDSGRNGSNTKGSIVKFSFK